jgi:hypothetical protein
MVHEIVKAVADSTLKANLVAPIRLHVLELPAKRATMEMIQACIDTGA